MALRVKVSARAASQVRKAAEWWADDRPAAPGAIAADFGESVALLAEQPGHFIYYQAAGDELRILAFWHASRGQQPVL
jgi:plasmid stabilization system protein ParE